MKMMTSQSRVLTPRILLGTIISATIILTASADLTNCTPPPAGLVSWWSAEGSANDSVGSKHGVLLNGASFAPGMVGQAFSFNGNDQCVQVPYSPSLVAANYSIEAWVKPLAQVSDFINQDLIFGQSFGHCQLVARTGNTGVRVAFAFGITHFIFFEVAGTSEIPIGQFSHLVGTWNGTTLRLYINGVLNEQSTPGASPVDSGCPFFIGGFYSPAAGSCNYVGQFFNGLIDEVSYFNRALTGGEIQAIYNAGFAGKCKSPAPPSILTQPQSQTVAVGASVSLSVVAAGTPPLSYQWRLNGTNIAGATGTSLTLSNVQPAQAGNYAMRVTNAFGSITSSNALLTVILPPPCVAPPSDLVSWWRAEGDCLDQAGGNNGSLHNGVGFTSGEVGQAFIFNGTNSYVEVPDSPALRLTNQLTIEFWVKRQQVVLPEYLLNKGGDWTRGALNYGVAFAAPQYNNMLQFLFAGGNRGAGSVTDLSWHHCAIVARNGDVDPTFYLDGVPQSVTYREGASTINLYPSTEPLHIGAQLDPAWNYYGKAIIDEMSLYSRALAVAEIQAIYTAGRSGKCATPTLPFISTQPANQTVTTGASASFRVAAGGAPPLSYQWRFNGTNIGGATGSVLMLTNVQAAQAGNYAARVTNSYGSTISSNAVLTVNQAPLCVTPPAGLVSWWAAEGNALDSIGSNTGVLHNGVGFTSGEVGQAFIFNGTNSYVEVPHSSALRLTNQLTIEFWVKRQQVVLPEYLLNKGGDWTRGALNYGVAFAAPQYNNMLQFLFAGGNRGAGSVTDLSWHHCAIVARNGDVDPTFYLDGVPQPVTYREGASTINLYPSTEPLHIGAQLDPAWNYYSKAIIDEMSLYSRALAVAEIQAIFNAGSAGKCKLLAPPSILTQPQSQTVQCSSNATFAVTASGLPPLAYRWYFGANLIPGATNTLLTLTSVSFAQAGNYSVVVTNAYGSATGGPAALTVVDTTPPSLSCPGGKVLEFQDERGTVATYSVTATDVCSAVTLVVTPPSGSLFPIGVTPVHVQVTDGCSNSAQCSFTVTVLGAQGVKSNVLTQLIALRSSVGLAEPFAQKFGDAIQHLANSLNPAYWIDQTHLQPKGGNTAMNEEKLAVGKLWEIMESRKCPVGPAVLQGFIDRIVKSDRLLAVISIQDAAKAGVKARKIAEALAMVVKGDREVASGHYANAIEHYRNAWRQVLQLRLQVALNPDGTTRVQFVGNNSTSYLIEVSTDMVKWVSLGTGTADADGNVEFTDPNVARQPLRFYRAVEQ